MAGRGLFDRLADCARGEGGARRGYQEDPLGSILEHLRVLLNSRQGQAPAAPGFGMVDFSDTVHQFPGSVQLLQQSIRATLIEFEPRLKNITVRHVPEEDPLKLRFEISAQLAEKGARGLLRFRTVMVQGGRFEVV